MKDTMVAIGNTRLPPCRPKRVAPARAGLGRVLLLGCAFLSLSALGAPESSKTFPGFDLFTNHVLRLRIEIAPRHVEQLRTDPRKYVPAAVRQDGRTWSNAFVHLKGAVGSFRDIDDKPALTLSFDRADPAQRFHGLRKIHLNNSVEDPTCLNEKIGSIMFPAVGVPAPRVGWARLELNGRDRGLYVLKEGATEDFLGAWFSRSDGNLYEGSGGDVTDVMGRECGPGPDDQADLNRVARAALAPTLSERWTMLSQAVDTDRFRAFMAMEILLGHHDGYCLARNNYRLYHDPATDKFVFIPHGMDQLFGRSQVPIDAPLSGLVAQAAVGTAEARQRYREELGLALTNAFDLAAMNQRVDEWTRAIRPALGFGERRSFDREIRGLKDRMARRHRYLRDALSSPPPGPIHLAPGAWLTVTNWEAFDSPRTGHMRREKAPDGKPALSIKTAAHTDASWRANLLLEPGLYRFEGAVRSAGVKPIDFGKGRGARLRVAGFAMPQGADLEGDTAWRPLATEFEVKAAVSVCLICELRAAQGEAWFDVQSLRIVRVR